MDNFKIKWKVRIVRQTDECPIRWVSNSVLASYLQFSRTCSRKIGVSQRGNLESFNLPSCLFEHDRRVGRGTISAALEPPWYHSARATLLNYCAAFNIRSFHLDIAAVTFSVLPLLRPKWPLKVCPKPLSWHFLILSLRPPGWRSYARCYGESPSFREKALSLKVYKCLGKVMNVINNCYKKTQV